MQSITKMPLKKRITLKAVNQGIRNVVLGNIDYNRYPLLKPTHWPYNKSLVNVPFF
jgi:hypothetical protein